MLKIYYESETENDNANPLSISNALIENPNLDLGDLEEISKHLAVYVRRCRLRQKEMQREIDIYRREHGLD